MQILNTLLEITICAAVIFAVTLLAKRLLADRLSPFLHYAVWPLFLLRLMLPVMFASPVQLIALPERAQAAIAAQAEPAATQALTAASRPSAPTAESPLARKLCMTAHWTDELQSTDGELLLPFDAIVGKLADLAREKYDYDITRETDPAHDLYIQHAELGLMRVGAPHAAAYTLEPVWSFFVAFQAQPDDSDPGLLESSFMGDPVRWNSLTISAVDGRAIDRDRGE